MKRINAKLVKTFDRLLSEIIMIRRPFDVERVAYLIAAVESAQFFQEQMRLTSNLVTREALIEEVVSRISLDGLWLEFGVAGGDSLRRIAAATDHVVYGFDSFEGIPEDWTHFQKKGRYSQAGRLPGGFPKNVQLIRGLFSESLPDFLNAHTESIAFLHIDSDLYTSAKMVLSLVHDRIVAGTIILFDEFFNYPGWKHHEYKAFSEFVLENNIKFEFIGFASSAHSVAVRISSGAF